MKHGVKIQNQVCLNPKISTTLYLFSFVPNEKETHFLKILKKSQHDLPVSCYTLKSGGYYCAMLDYIRICSESLKLGY